MKGALGFVNPQPPFIIWLPLIHPIRLRTLTPAVKHTDCAHRRTDRHKQQPRCIAFDSAGSRKTWPSQLERDGLLMYTTGLYQH